MKITVIGAGNTGTACAVHLYHAGCQVLLYTRSEEKAAYLKENGIVSELEYPGNYPVPVTADLEEAVTFGDLLIVNTWANAHKEVFENIYKICDKNLLIYNGNWGALEAYQIRRKYYPESTRAIMEADGMPYMAVCQKGRLQLKGIKKSLTVGGIQGRVPEDIRRFLEDIYGEVIVRKSVFETSLSAPNPIIHIPLALFNISRIENHEEFKILTEGFSENADHYIMGIDKEREALAEALGVPYERILQQLNRFWGTAYSSLRELFSSNPVYSNLRGPDSVSHRFIAEDLPYGIQPLTALGDLLGVPVPYCRALTSLFALYLSEGERESVSFTKELLEEI